MSEDPDAGASQTDGGRAVRAGAAGPQGYERLTLVGRGGTASVFSATRSSDSVHVAIKVFDSPDSSAFERQRRAAERLRDIDGIAQVLDESTMPDGRPCLVFPFAAAGSFADRMDRFGTTDPARVAQLGSVVAHALGAAHRAGVLHRDVKPSNVLLDGEDRPQLADFGAATIIEPATATDTLAVTIMYAAPEVLESGSADERSDVYSLGLTLLALAIGRHPIGEEGDSGLAALVNRICTDGAPDPADLGCPDGLAAVLRQATELDPAERYPTAEKLAAALAEVAADPATAPKDSAPARRAAPGRERRSGRRRLAPVTAIAAIVVLAAAVALIWTSARDDVSTDETTTTLVLTEFGEPVTAANGILGPLYEQAYATYVGMLEPGCGDEQNLVELSIHAGPDDQDVATPWKAVAGDGAGTFIAYMPCDTHTDEARYFLGATGRWFNLVAELDDAQYEVISQRMRTNETSPSPDYTVDEDVLTTLTDPEVYRGWTIIDQADE